MPSIRISKELNDRMYFVTPTVKNWYYIFDRYRRWDILADCLRYHVENKKLKIFGHVLMLNHLHIIVQCPDVSGLIRDFKKFTSRKIQKNLRDTEPNVLELFKNREGSYEFWRKTSMPELIESEWFFLQKLKYIHSNPVVKQYVRKAEDWYWSSAIDYNSDRCGPLPICRFGDGTLGSGRET